MSLRDLSAPRVLLIGRHTARHIIRGGAGVIFAVLTLYLGLWASSMLVTPTEMAHKVTDGEGKEALGMVVSAGASALKWILGASDRQFDFFFHARPPLASGVLILILFLCPFFVSLGAYDQTSGDSQTRALRYELVRTERVNLFLGRFVGTALFVLSTMAILCAVITLYLVGRVRFYGAGEVSLWMLQGTLAVVLLALPYIALCALISALLDSPFISMIISQVIVLIVPAVVWAISISFKGGRYLGYVLPWPLKFDLLGPSSSGIVVASLAMLGYTAVYLYAGLRIFEARDL